MSDLVERIKAHAPKWEDAITDEYGKVDAWIEEAGRQLTEAAAEIERLRAEVAAMRTAFVRLHDSTDLEMGDGDLAREIAASFVGHQTSFPA